MKPRTAYITNPWRRLFQQLAELYTGVIVLWLLLWRLCGDANGWLALANAWAFWLHLTGIPAGAIALVRRSWWMAAAWSLGMGSWFVRRYHRQLQGTKTATPNHPSPGGRQDHLRVLSANLLNRPRDLAGDAEAILVQNADLLLFQEAIASHAQQLDRRLASAYPYRCWIPYGATNMGLGVASRLPFAVNGFWQNVGLEPYALRISIALSGGPLDVYCVHFISPSHQVRRYGPTALLHVREQQILTVLGEIAGSSRPAIIAGDWNSTEGADSYRWAAAQLIDGWLEGGMGPGWTWPRSLKELTAGRLMPLLRLDYLFHTGNLRSRRIHVESMQVVTDERIGSDHCPLLANLSVAVQ